MDHFLSGLDAGPSPWYASRPPVSSHAHEFAIGTSSFQLIPITGSNNHVPSSHTSYSTSNTLNSHSAFRSPADPKVKSEVKDDDDSRESKSPTPSVALTPLSTNMAHHSHKAKNSERWDTKKVCNICGKVLSRGDKLKNHIRTHTNNFPFHCDTCGQGFLRSEGLRVHTRIHTGERPYICIVCGKAYTRKDKLTRHAIVHTGERPFVCQHCGKSFTRKDKMQRHEMIHKVDKPFTCVPCNVEFVRQETYNAHMEKKHPERLPYTVVQQPREGSPSYHPQGLNLSSNADNKSSSSTSRSHSNSKHSSSTTSSHNSAGASNLSSSNIGHHSTVTNLPGGITLPGGLTLPSGITLPGGTSLPGNPTIPGGLTIPSSSSIPGLASHPSSLLSGSSLLGGLHGISGSNSS
ncbi:zinc finger protein 184-like [Penaeus japonicus]|uniref:zinc finger protein 184-like n=1 Tax=Penaeus japonicus TaxID=27405 RepID=UPI001C70D566|nr:zinc finger protein 184-like [Penaeus japonicus]